MTSDFALTSVTPELGWLHFSHRHGLDPGLEKPLGRFLSPPHIQRTQSWSGAAVEAEGTSFVPTLMSCFGAEAAEFNLHFDFM